jgi:hypothetical protein
MPRFKKGNPPGPGRPPGCRNKTTVLFEEIAAERMAKIIGQLFDHADRGSLQATQIALTRFMPRPRGRRVPLDLPPIRSAADLVQANAAVVAAMADGTLSAEEAASVSQVLEIQRRAIETHVHEKQIAALEEKDEENPSGGSIPTMDELFPEESKRR